MPSTATPRAALPLLAAAQAQKHVTHNEALIQLDTLAFARFLDRDLTAPPGSPPDGDTYLIHATATGLWTGQDGKIAAALDGAWRFYEPFAGLVAFVIDESKLIVFDGASWLDYAALLALQNVPLVGINATADATDKLSVKSAALLFDNIGAGVQAKINKHAAADTASLLYQTGFSGRAELGLTGDDNFHLKVSPDGSTWYEGLTLDRNTGSLLLKHVDVTGTTTIGAGHLGRIVRADATAGAFNIALPASADSDDWVIVRKKDTGANRVSVKDDAGNDIAWLSAQYDEAMFAFWDGGWTAVRWTIAPLFQVFASSGTYIKPPLARHLQVICIGGGGGGGSGRRGAAGTARAGGQGGASGAGSLAAFAATGIGATESVTVGAGGSAGAAQTSDTTDGNPGGAGGTSSFGSHSSGPGGGGGAAAAALASRFANFAIGLGASSTSVTAVPATPADGVTGTGGAGGGISTGNVAFNGASGAGGSTGAGSALAGGSGGVVDTAAATAGATVTSTADQTGGSGGGGGAASIAAAAGSGKDGGAPGGGAGGGGASLNGNASGAGGAGGRGEVRIATWF